MPPRAFRMSVSTFAQPHQRQGHIDAFSGFRANMPLGQLIHTKIQTRLAAKKTAYEKEVAVSKTLSIGQETYLVSGRIDSLYEEKGYLVVEEIKSTSNIIKLKERLEEQPNHPYILQLKTYCYFLHDFRDAPLRAQMRLVAAQSGNEEIYPIEFDAIEFSKWVQERCEYLASWHRMQIQQHARRVQLSEGLQFPFKNYRKGQEALLTSVAEAAQKGEHLMLQAPTGLGKSMGVLFPLLKNSLSRGKVTFYLAPKNSQFALAESAAAVLAVNEHQPKTVTISAKSKVCMKEEVICTPEHCEFAKNYYDKLEDHKVVEHLQNFNLLNQTHFVDAAERYEVCPFELSIELSKTADLIVGDYNYGFSPHAALEYLFLDENGDPSGTNVAIDEAHNLVQRSLDYFSPALSTYDLRMLSEKSDLIPADLRRRWKTLLTKTRKMIEALVPHPKIGEFEFSLPTAPVFEHVQKVNHFLSLYLDNLSQPLASDPVLELANHINEFANVASVLDSNFFCTYQKSKFGMSVKINCVDASSYLAKCLGNFHTSVAFSATLKPEKFFKNLMGYSKINSHYKEFDSPFPEKNRKLLIIPQVSTKLRDRQSNYRKIAEAIERIIKVKQGNYIVFFPSFSFLQAVAQFLGVLGVTYVEQVRGMDRATVDDTCASFFKESDVTLLAVQGGIFAEGLDFKGDALIGAIIVGPGLPTYSLQRQLMKKLYDQKFDGDGFNYAFTYPAMAKVVQAAGRVIRTEEDKGLVVLMDRRFLDEEYLGAMPSYWTNHNEGLVSQKILDDVARFWRKV